MNTGDLLTVKEFAEKAGVSRQTVYNRLDKDLTAYLTEIDSVKYIDKAALKFFVSKLDSQIDSQIDNDFDSKTVKFDSDLTAYLTTIDTLQAQIQVLQDQLTAKDTQISLLQAHTDQQQQTINNLTNALTQQQALNAAAAVIQKQLIDQSGGDLPPETSGNSSRENAADQSGNDTKAAPEPVKKKSLLDRLNPFKRK